MEAGVLMLTDDGDTVDDPLLYKNAMEYATHRRASAHSACLLWYRSENDPVLEGNGCPRNGRSLSTPLDL